MANQSDLDDVARQVLAIATKVKGGIYDGQSSASRLSVLARAQSDEASRLAGRLEALKFSPQNTELQSKGLALQTAVSNLKMWCDNVATSVEGNGNAGTTTELATYSTTIADKLRTAAPTVPMEEERFKVTQKLVTFTEKAKAKQAEALAIKAAAKAEANLSRVTNHLKIGIVDNDAGYVVNMAIAARQAILERVQSTNVPDSLVGYKSWIETTIGSGINALQVLCANGTNGYAAFKMRNNQIDSNMKRLRREFGIR